MADQGGSQHGIARTSRVRTEEQRRQDLERIAKYRELDEKVRKELSQQNYSPETFHLTSKLLKLNPEYYTIWNARRRLLIYGLFSKPSAGSSPSTALPSSSPTGTTTTSSGASSSSSSTATPPAPGSQTAGKSGTTVDGTENKSQEDNKSEQEKKDLDLIKSELGFTIPLLLASPKCYWIWSYRLWILQQAIQRLSVPIARRIWEEELLLASKMLAKDRRNFHAWGYRRHVVEQLEAPVLGGTSMVEAEFKYTTDMINTDLSNFSAWHNRSKLIPRLLDERKADDQARENFLNAEFAQIFQAINVGPEDQSLWYYHHFLMLNLVNPVGHPTIAPALTREDRVTYVTREIEQIKELLEDYDDVQLIYEALIDYTLFLCQFLERQPDGSEKAEIVGWLDKVKKLDPMRAGRWADLERDWELVE
ncbi:geranylgeranyl transferase type-2 subunit alpha [Naviculisporaceae sp. PSN 640]